MNSEGRPRSAAKTILVSIGWSILVGCIFLVLELRGLSRAYSRHSGASFWYPYGFLAFHIWGWSEPVLLVQVLLQFPVYGLILGWAKSRHRLERVLGWLVFIHFARGITASMLHSVNARVGWGWGFGR